VRRAHGGGEFSAADVQMMFPLEFAAFARLVDARHARLRDYLVRIQARPAYRRAVDKGGAYAFDAASAQRCTLPATKPLMHRWLGPTYPTACLETSDDETCERRPKGPAAAINEPSDCGRARLRGVAPAAPQSALLNYLLRRRASFLALRILSSDAYAWIRRRRWRRMNCWRWQDNTALRTVLHGLDQDSVGIGTRR
jgi:hypothetical protein